MPATQHRQVMLKDIEPNPYRGVERCPLQEERIQTLVESIQETGFWENLLGRVRDDKVEIAYGHHRVEAARRVYPPDHMVEIRIRELSDGDMIRILARENSEDYRCSIAAIDDAVAQAGDYLRAHPDEARRVLSSGAPEFKRVCVGAPMIAKFIGKSLDSVEKSIERLTLIRDGVLAQDALYQMPSARSADSFASIVKDLGIQREAQSEIAKRLVADGPFSHPGMLKAVASYLPKAERIRYPHTGEVKLAQGIRQIGGLIETLSQLKELVPKEEAISLDMAREFERSSRRFDVIAGEARRIIAESRRAKPLTFSAFQRILKLMMPIIPNNVLAGPHPGLIYDSETNRLVAARHRGGMIYNLENPLAERSLVITKEYAGKFLKLKGYRWSGLVVSNEHYSVQVGRIRITTQIIPKPDFTIPDFSSLEFYPIPPDLAQTIANLSRFMPADDRKHNLDGLFVGDGAVYACDNYRAVRVACEHPSVLTNVFLPRFSVDLLRGQGGFLREIGKTDSQIVSRSEGIYAYALRMGQYPPIARLFERAEAASRTVAELDIHDKKPTNALRVFRDKMLISPLIDVILAGKMLRLRSSRSNRDTVRLDLDLKSRVDHRIRFRRMDKSFITALLTHPIIEVGEDWVLLRREGHATTYLFSLRGEANRPLVFFEAEEILSPRELWERYRVRIKQTDTSNRPYTFAEVKELLRTEQARLPRGTTDLGVLTVSVGEGEERRAN